MNDAEVWKETTELSKDNTEKHNSMSDIARHISSVYSAKQAIQYLLFEKKRHRKRHMQTMREIDDHIKNHLHWLRNEA